MSYITKPKFVRTLDITFLLPSIKDYNSFGRKVVDSIYNTDSNKTFEVIVCHPDFVDDNRVKHIYDNKRCGTTYALNHSAKIGRGKVIYSLTDDSILTKDPFGAYDFLQSDTFKDRKFKITTFPGGFGDDTSWNGVIEDSNSELCLMLKKLDSFVEVPRFPVMCFPILSEETLNKHLNGCIFNPILKYLGDVWLGAFLNFNGEPGIQYNDCWLQSMGGKEAGMAFDPILGRNSKKFEGEAFVNYYRLCKNYTTGKSYNYGKDLFISNEQILERIK
jgi:hypothetical protein